MIEESQAAYCLLVAAVPVFLVAVIVWALWGKFDDEFFKRDE